MSPSTKICPTCKREKCDKDNQNEAFDHILDCQKCHGSCSPAEKEADEMRLVEEIVATDGTKIAAIYGTYYGSKEMVKAFSFALQQAKAQGRRESDERHEKIAAKLRKILTNNKGNYDAHHIDIVVRRDGKDLSFEGDFLKDLIDTIKD